MAFSTHFAAGFFPPTFRSIERKESFPRLLLRGLKALGIRVAALLPVSFLTSSCLGCVTRILFFHRSDSPAGGRLGRLAPRFHSGDEAHACASGPPLPTGGQHSQTAAEMYPDSVRFRRLHSSSFHSRDGTAPMDRPFLFVPFHHLKPTETGPGSSDPNTRGHARHSSKPWLCLVSLRCGRFDDGHGHPSAG